MELKSFLAAMVLVTASCSAAHAQTRSLIDRGTIRVITDVLIPPRASSSLASLPVANGQVLGCPAGYQRSNFPGQFAICQGVVCNGRKPLCVKYETISPDTLLTSRPSVATKTVVWRLRPSLTACGANSILAGQMPDCSNRSCPARDPWNICADTTELDLRAGGRYLSDLKVTAHGLHHPSPPCPAGFGVAAGFADGSGGYLQGVQRICQGSLTLPRGPQSPQAPSSGITITQQPADREWDGVPVTFSVMATGARSNSRALSYRWYKREAPQKQRAVISVIPGATSNTLTISTPPSRTTDLSFYVEVSQSGATTVHSNAAMLSWPISITEEPQDELSEGGPVTFSVGAIAKRDLPLSYQWFQKLRRWEGSEPDEFWAPIAGATESTLVVDSSPQDARYNAHLGNSAQYYVEVSAQGVRNSLRSRTATMSWAAPQPQSPAQIECGTLPEWVAPNLKAGVELQVPLGCSVNRPVPLNPRWSVCIPGECHSVELASSPTTTQVRAGGRLFVQDLFSLFRSPERTDGALFDLLQQGKFYIDLTVSAEGVEELVAPRILVLPPGVGAPTSIAPPAVHHTGFWNERICFRDRSLVPTALVVSAIINRTYREAGVNFVWETRASESEDWHPVRVLGNLVISSDPTYTEPPPQDSNSQYTTIYDSRLRFPFAQMSPEDAESLWSPREYRVTISTSIPGLPDQTTRAFRIRRNGCMSQEAPG